MRCVTRVVELLRGDGAVAWYSRRMRIAALLAVLAACGGHGAHGGGGGGGDAAPPIGDAPPAPETTTLAALTANDTSASPLFGDDYHNYNTTAQTGNGNGDLALGTPASQDLTRGAISKVPFAPLAPAGTLPAVETQTWFCHLTANEDASASPPRLVANARCGSHVDVGYNSDDPDQVARQVADLQSRGIAAAIMDWSGKDSRHDGDATYYPTSGGTDHVNARGSTEIATNAIYAWLHAAEALPAGTLQIAVSEDEGITNCRKGWAGGCACWPAYGTTCNETSQVISDLSYIDAHWASSPAYMRLAGKPVVTFFAPDYNACPDPTAADCQHIDWNAVHQFVGDQVWIFENKGGYAHAFSGGGFGWLSTTLYPGSDSTYGVGYVTDYDAYVLHPGNVTADQHVVASSFKGFDDGVTDGWYYGDGSHTRYVEQRCGQTWLATLARVRQDFAASAPEVLQLVTWDDYEEATELETGIDTCIGSIDGQVSGGQLTWTIAFGSDLTNGATGDERTIDHYTVWASADGQTLVRVAPDLVRDQNGALPHALDLAAHPPPAGSHMLFVQAVGGPFLRGAVSAPIALP